MKEMKRVIKYVIDTGNKGLKMTPQKKENIINIFHTMTVTSRATSNLESAYPDLLLF